MNEIKVNSWNELQNKLFEGWWNPKINRYRAANAYRGLSDSNYKLDTTLMRLGGNYAKMEPHLLRNFNKYGTQFMEKSDSIWNTLTIAQHHGLPTRILDWTYSPMVALHFATANVKNYDREGVIWIVDFGKVRKYLPDLFKNKLEKEDAYVFSVEMLNEILPGEIEALKEFNSMYMNEKFVVFLEPPSLDERVINQFSIFSFMSDPTLCMDNWLAELSDKDIWQKIIIPSELKGEIRDKLDQSKVMFM
ncbi:MAG: FRG domain-containing protein [Candidatus Lokiarchaeota archaeon]|nr:FRG domain-containing protein [Candidatus Lokiarchaeota archaeon]